MKCYHLRNELSSKDQQKHVYVKDDKGRLIEIESKNIKERNGLIVIELDKKQKQ